MNNLKFICNYFLDIFIVFLDPNLSLEKYVCHLYTDVLSKLPAVVRKWWNTSPSRQKTFVDTLTTNFVSPIICQEELMAIASKKEKHENMQVRIKETFSINISQFEDLYKIYIKCTYSFSF